MEKYANAFVATPGAIRGCAAGGAALAGAPMINRQNDSPRQVQQSMVDMDRWCMELMAVVGELEVRLAPVVHHELPVQQANAGATVPREVRVPLAEAIEVASERIQEATRRLSSLYNRLEV